MTPFLRYTALSILASVSIAWSHGADAAAAVHPAHIGSGVDMIEPDDSLGIAIDLFGYLGHSLAAGSRVGTPLGVGGKGPLYYNQWGYRTGPFDRPHMEKPDLRPGYEDFSYIPLWQPYQLELRTQYRFLPRLWGSISLGYDADPVGTESEDALHAPVIEELLLKWAPEALPGWAFTFGQLTMAGSYCPVFDHFPLEHSEFGGLNTEYKRDLSGAGGLEIGLSLGQELVGRLKKTTLDNPQDIGDPGTAVYADGIRARNHLLGTLRFTSDAGFYLGGLGEYQSLPEDSTDIVLFPATASKYRWRSSHGWQAGGEIGFEGPVWDHHLTLSHGEGDINMAWSGPDAVSNPATDPTVVEWTRKGSSLSQAVLWSGFHLGRWRAQGGAWMQWRAAAKDSGYTYDTGLPAPDDIGKLRAEDFRAVKLAVEPSVKIGPLLNLGFRYDRFLYLDPTAHSNTNEPQTDQALRGIPTVRSDGSIAQLEGPSRWEREAVDCHILSPFAQVDLGGDFHARAGWSGAWYSEEVSRQGTIADFHGNVTLATWFTYRFGQAEH